MIAAGGVAGKAEPTLDAAAAVKRKAATENPDDPVIQEHLRHAYQQKAVLYEMATVRSLE